MYLRLVCAGAHDPVAILADAYTLTGFLELEVLEQFHSIRIFGILVLSFLLWLPVWSAGDILSADGVHRNCGVGELHGALR